MKIKTKSKCILCGETYDPVQASKHLLGCINKQSDPVLRTSESYLVRVSWLEQPNLYWMFITLPKDSSLSQLDQFLRKEWLECCGHLSEFKINGDSYMSHTESGNSSQSMKNKVNKLFSQGLKIDYTYDMGSSTELELKVIGAVESPVKKITILMKNDPPTFACESCKKTSEIICSFCGSTTCANCREDHSCALDEEDTYMLMPLVNSPRTGVCGYEG